MEGEKGMGNVLGFLYTVCKLAFLDRQRDQERKQDLYYIGCAATAEYTGSTTLTVFDE